MGRHHMPGDGQAHGPNAPTVLLGGRAPRPATSPAARPRGTRPAVLLVLLAALFVAFMAGAATQNAITPNAPTAVEVTAR